MEPQQTRMEHSILAKSKREWGNELCQVLAGLANIVAQILSVPVGFFH